MVNELSLFAAATLPEIDLHTTESVVEALETLEHELYRLVRQGSAYCRVIHGIGGGVLAAAVHEVFAVHPLIAASECFGGFCIVRFSYVAVGE